MSNLNPLEKTLGKYCPYFTVNHLTLFFKNCARNNTYFSSEVRVMNHFKQIEKDVTDFTKNEGEVNRFSVQKFPRKSMYQEYIKAKVFVLVQRFVFINFKFLNLFVYMING